MAMDVLMLGWEFPPFISGGLGTACYGLTRAMENLRINILMLLPTSTSSAEGKTESFFELDSSAGPNPAYITFKPVPSRLPNPYQSSHPLRLCCAGAIGGYDGNLVERVHEYAQLCKKVIPRQNFDVIHAHDWITFPAGMMLAEKLSRPLVVHVHATEFDRSGNCFNPKVYKIERQGMAAASRIIAVSQYTADILIHRYGIPRDKIRIVHNGISPKTTVRNGPVKLNGEKIVLFLGRITGQKGPKHFIEAAEKVLKKRDRVKFVIAGWGDLAPELIQKVAAGRFRSEILFTGFLRGDQVDRAYQAADVFVMPSVSEPFGLTALEAIQQGVPVIISKTAGVGEILHGGAVKVDFWDSEKMAEAILDILGDTSLAARLIRTAREEIVPLTWEAAARKCQDIYYEVACPVMK